MGQDQGNLYLLNKRKLRPKVCRFFRYFYKFDSKNDHQLLKSTIFDLKSVCALTLSRMRGSGGQKNPFNSFSSLTSPKEGICPQNFLTFSFNPFVTLLQSFNATTSTSLNLLNLHQDCPSKNRFFWSNPYRIKSIITSLGEMLELPKYDHIYYMILVTW